MFKTMKRIIPCHLSRGTWNEYIYCTHEESTVTFPKHKLPEDIYLYASDCDFEEDVIIEILAEKPLTKYSTDDDAVIPDDLLALINYCIAHDIKYITFLEYDSMLPDLYYKEDLADSIIPDLKVYDWE